MFNNSEPDTPISLSFVSYANIDNLYIFFRSFLIRFGVLDSVNNIQALYRTAEDRVFLIKPGLQNDKLAPSNTFKHVLP